MKRMPVKATVSKSQTGKKRTANVRLTSRSTVITGKATIKTK